KFNRMLEALKERENIDIVTINDVLKTLENIKESLPPERKAEIEKEVSELNRIIERKREFIK
ncbi:MAG: hypothetical protein ACPL7I_06920, partial [Myxococcota bacterium]